MANTKISNLTALGAAPASGDLFAIVDVSANQTKKVTMAHLINAVEANANTFSATQTLNNGCILSNASSYQIKDSGGITRIVLNKSGDDTVIASGNGTNLLAKIGATEAIRINSNAHVLLNTTTNAGQLAVNGEIAIVDGMTAPSATSGFAKIYVDSADGDLKVKFGDGTIKTIATD